MSDGRGRLFGSVADLYDRYRPEMPAALAPVLGDIAGLRVLDVGAGTGKLTRFLAARGALVSAVEPDDDMRAVLRARSPEVAAVRASAEDVPFADGAFDLVASSSAWHWFEHPAAELELARVLVDGGRLVVAWNGLSRAEAWARDLVRLREREDDPYRPPRGWHADLSGAPFEACEDFEAAWTWTRSVEDVVGVFATYSGSLVLADGERSALFDEVRRVVSERAVDGMVAVPMSLRGTTARRRPRSAEGSAAAG
jgi:SAM-dependent methyltransferase